MDALRWIFILIVIGTAAAVAMWVGLSEPAKPALAPDPVPAVATAPVPTAPLPPAEPASTVPVAQAATAASTPAPRPAAPRIGSEGYGPYIERAAAGTDAAAAWEALRWLQQCSNTDHVRESLEKARSAGLPPDLMAQLIQEVDAEGRRCQTVTGHHQTLKVPLALLAMRGGVKQAASSYAAMTLPQDLSPGMRQEVLAQVRSDARSGHAGSLLGAASLPDAWGLSDAERLAYVFASAELVGQPGRKLLDQWTQLRVVSLRAAPTAAQLDAAKVAGQQIVAQLRATP